MFTFAEGTNLFAGWGVWLIVFAALFGLNEFSRRTKWAGFLCFIVLPIILSILWATVLRETTYLDWFHLAKVYSSTAGCIGFWAIKWVKGASDKKWLLCFPPLILAINIIEAVIRDIEVGINYAVMAQDATADTTVMLMGGPWNFMNAAAGILNIITITGWFGICLKKETSKDKSHDMLWPDMLWFWIIAYDLWNFTYTYNCLPHHSFYCGFALLLAPTLCAFTVGKGAWLQHRAATLALWCMFAQTFPLFQDESMWRVDSTYNPSVYMFWGAAALAANIAVFVYMIYKVKKTKRNPYLGELYTDLKEYKSIKALAAPTLNDKKNGIA